jgi:hypothetical protein
VRGDLEPLERFDVQLLREPPGEARPDAGDRPEQLLGLEGAAQPFELRPTARRQHLDERRRDAAADAGQGRQPVAAGRPDDLRDRPFEPGDDRRRPLVGGNAEAVAVLLRQEIGVRAEACGEGRVAGRVVAKLCHPEPVL